MDRKINYTPNMPVAWQKKNKGFRVIKTIALVIVIALFASYGFQVITAGSILKKIKDNNPDTHFYFMYDRNPTLLTRLMLGDKAVEVDDIFTHDIKAGDIILIDDEIIDDDTELSALKCELVRLFNKDVIIAVYSQKVYVKTWINLITVRPNLNFSSDRYDYYMYLHKNGDVRNFKHIDDTANIKAFKEATFLQHILAGD